MSLATQSISAIFFFVCLFVHLLFSVTTQQRGEKKNVPQLSLSLSGELLERHNGHTSFILFLFCFGFFSSFYTRTRFVVVLLDATATESSCSLSLSIRFCLTFFLSFSWAKQPVSIVCGRFSAPQIHEHSLLSQKYGFSLLLLFCSQSWVVLLFTCLVDCYYYCRWTRGSSPSRTRFFSRNPWRCFSLVQFRLSPFFSPPNKSPSVASFFFFACLFFPPSPTPFSSPFKCLFYTINRQHSFFSCYYILFSS